MQKKDFLASVLHGAAILVNSSTTKEQNKLLVAYTFATRFSHVHDLSQTQTWAQNSSVQYVEIKENRKRAFFHNFLPVIQK